MRAELTPEARRQLIRLPRKTYEVVAAATDGPITENLHRASNVLRDELARYRSVRRGDYRVLLIIDDEEQVITIVRIEHRSTVYRPR